MSFKFTKLRHSAFINQGVVALIGTLLPVISLAQAPEDANWDAKFQTTYVWQSKLPFSAAYSGPNSFSPDKAESYTFSTTAYLGLRLWQGGEFYVTPEITQGVAFSNLTGLGGFTNGEITRASGSTPTIYRQKLFLRQTWNQGGGTEHVEADLNQLAGSQDKNRFVLTVGNFSTLDVFDHNEYASDPRTQFMNWGNMTYAAYDYAADARGFGWGFAGEWYKNDWVFRFGRMTGPKEPNMLPVDTAIGQHYGDQIEVEHVHILGGQPGKVRILAWRNRARLASFADALAYLEAHPGADQQTIFNVRSGEKIKYGIGVNIEQAINDNLGFFLRAMKADGRTETYAFTEVDGSFATGLVFSGAKWGRANDVLGLSLMENTLSAERRRYLEAGGISFFIGDGALRYQPEQIFESYYSLNVWKKTSVTADYQHIWNPAYNADRGPVNIISARLHTEF
ncbi:carbohydrate porin [Sulfuriferula nivalis]|uniref:Porin n=1 Tax=Sulfuriferula nivalis TaxID=2675298 RepID=A0A809RP34_9PROT|nr:carbohydrate porin [Sulfuriferula nivalis]BBP00581.1 hypothetical protein SFSGTM_12890 [Sulfuriferula nivalis]